MYGGIKLGAQCRGEHRSSACRISHYGNGRSMTAPTREAHQSHVIARSEATRQSPGTILRPHRHRCRGNTLPGDSHGRHSRPRNDIFFTRLRRFEHFLPVRLREGQDPPLQWQGPAYIAHRAFCKEQRKKPPAHELHPIC